MRLKNFIAASIMLIFISGVALAQEDLTSTESPAAKPAEKTGSINFSVKSYLNWHTVLTESTDNGSGEKMNTFEIERVYFTMKKDLDDVFSGRVTFDVGNEQIIEKASLGENGAVDSAGDPVETADGSETSKYRVYVKYAYVQAKNKIGPASYKIKFGMIDTPVIGYVDKLADQRWLHKNLIDDAKNVLTGIDNSADMGASIDLGFMDKMVNVVLALTNGEGYKKTCESVYDNESDPTKNSAHGKAVYGRLTIAPIEGLSISGYYRREGTSSNQSDFNKGYMGGGIAYANDLIMVGANYILPFHTVDGETALNDAGEEEDLSMLDCWLTVTPEKFVGMPLLVMARYGYGDDGALDDDKVTFMGAGLGYKFNKKFRVMAWYEQYDSEAADLAETPNPDAVFALKAELKM